MEKITYDLVRSDRKTVEIRIRSDGQPGRRVEVRAPRKTPVAEIERFLETKRSWIEKHIAEQNTRRPVQVDARKILYQGKWYTIGTNTRGTISFDGTEFSVPEGATDEQIRASMPGLMQKLAKQVFLPQVYAMAKAMQLSPARITITGAKTKWGSCSGIREKGVGQNLSFSWRLLAAPPDAIHYVIVHELCHMRELNHSPVFWALVENYVPDWRAKKEKLAEVQTWVEAYYGR